MYNDNNNPTSETQVVTAIQNKSLPPTAMAIILYSLSVIQPGYVISFNHVTIRNVLGIKRTSFFNAMKCLKELSIITKRTKNTYRLNMGAVIPQRSSVEG